MADQIVATLQEWSATAAALKREHELIVAMHPTDASDEIRARIEATPFTELRESNLVPPGKVYLIRPGLLDGGEPFRG